MRVPCDLDLGAAEDRERGRGAVRRAGRRAARRAGRRRHRARHLARAAGGPRRLAAWRSTAASSWTSACPPTGCCPPRSSRPSGGWSSTAVCGARPLAEGRPPMGIACAQQDVARVYPLPDDPERCLEDFLDAGRRARARHGRAAGAPGGLGRALPRALGRRLPRDRLAARHTVRPVRRARVLIPVAFGRLRLPRPLVAARPRADGQRHASAPRCSTLRARPGAPATPTRCSRRLPACRARAGVRADDARAGARSCAARARADPHLHAVGAAGADPQGRDGARRVARRATACRSSSACACGARGR